MGNTNQNQFQDQQSPRSKAEVVQERRRAKAIKVEKKIIPQKEIFEFSMRPYLFSFYLFFHSPI